MKSSVDSPEPMNYKIVGVVIAFAVSCVFLFVTLVVLALIGVRETTLVQLGSAYAAPMAGLLFVSWKRPQMFVAPVKSASHWLNQRLALPVQRAVFLLASCACVPWFAIRVVGETFEYSSIREYARSAYYPLANTLFNVSYWSYEAEWYDWLMVVALIGILASIYWHVTIAPIAKWVTGSKP